MEALHALLALVASVQVRVPALPGSPSRQPHHSHGLVLPGGMTLLRTPAVEVLVVHKLRLSELLEQRRYDKVAAVRQVAAAAALELAALPDPPDQEQLRQQDQDTATWGPDDSRDATFDVNGVSAVRGTTHSQKYQHQQQQQHAGQALLVAAHPPGTAVVPARADTWGQGQAWRQQEQAGWSNSKAGNDRGRDARNGSCWGLGWQPNVHTPGGHPARIR